MTNGTVKWFSEDRGFGFLSNDNGGDDVFVHHSALNNIGSSTLSVGQKVSYDVESDPKNSRRLRASNVRLA